MFNGKRDKVGDRLSVAILLAVIPSFISGFCTAAIFCGKLVEKLQREAIEHGVASYKADNKGSVTFEWNK